MRAVLHGVLRAVAFVLELSVLAACAGAAYRWPENLVVKVAVAGLALVVMALLWGLFAAPRAARRLTGMPSVAFRVGWIGVGTLATAWVLGPVAGVVLAAASLADALGLRALGLGPQRQPQGSSSTRRV